MLAAYLLCDVLLTAVMLVLIWKRMLPLKNTWQRILASLCNPMVFAGIVGNLFALLPWPLDQLDHGTESAGHLLVLGLGLVLLREMKKNGELKGAEQGIQMIQTTVKFSGMACSMCEAHINDTIRGAFPVEKVSSSHSKGETVILSKEPLDEKALRAAIDATGYKAGEICTETYVKRGLFSFLKK